MKSKTTVVVLVVAITAILFCVALTNMHLISTPRLVIQFEGKPASNVTLILPDGGAGPYQLDGDGSITAREIGWRESLILLPKPDGGGVSVGFPQLRRLSAAWNESDRLLFQQPLEGFMLWLEPWGGVRGSRNQSGKGAGSAQNKDRSATIWARRLHRTPD